MNRLRRFDRATITIVAVIAAIALIMASIAAFAVALLSNLDVKHIEARINQTLLAKKQRHLKIEGPLNLRLWPALGIELGPVSLSEQHSTAIFAKLDSARLSVQWWPLLSRHIVIDAIDLGGLAVTIERDQNGQLNIADLLEGEAGEKWAFDIDALNLTQGQLTWRDHSRDQAFVLDKLSVRTGRLANTNEPIHGVLKMSGQLHDIHATSRPHVASLTAAPQTDIRLDLATRYALNTAKQHHTAHAVALQLSGRLGGLPAAELTLNIASIEARAAPGKSPINHLDIHELTLNTQTTSLDLRLDAPHLQLVDNHLIAAPLTLQLAVNDIGRTGDLVLRGHMKTPLVADLTARSATLDGITTRMEISAPSHLIRPLQLTLHGRANTNLTQSTAAINLQGELDASHLAVQMHFDRLAPPSIHFALDLDSIDLDRLMPPPVAGNTQKPTTPATIAAMTPAPPIAVPDSLELQGRVKINQLMFAGIRARKLRLVISSKNEQLNIAEETH